MPAPYLLPQVLVFQEFNEISPEIANPLRAWIVGPNANLHRYAVEEEKAEIALGEYVAALETGYEWPARTAGAVVDRGAVHLYIDNAKLRYFQDQVGADSEIAMVSGKKNRIRSDSVNFKSVTGFPRADVLLERDVQIGDLVYVRGSSGGDQAELNTYVRDIAYEAVAASVAAAVQDSANPATVSQNVAITQPSGPVNSVELLVDITDFDALSDGVLSDTFTITVLGGSTDGDFTTALVRVQSSSGIDYVSSVEPAAAGDYITVGTRGLQIGFDTTGDSETPGTDPDDLIAGQVFRAVVQTAWTKPTATSGGTYVGTKSTTYVVEVTAGGKFSEEDVPRVSVHTIDGNDGAANVLVPALSQAIPLGSGGATLTFSGGSVTGLRKGDKYYVTVTAASTGRASTLVLGHDLPAILQAAEDLDLELFIKADFEIPAYTTSPAPGFNYETSDTEITVAADIHGFHDSWTDGGVAQPLPIVGGQLFVEYREWLSDLTAELGSISDISEIDAIPGPLDPANPLKWAVSKAVANSNGTGVRFTAIADPTDNQYWIDALALGTQRSDLYSLVPLTEDREILDLFVAHVNSMSSESRGQWRKVFVPLVAEEVAPIITAALTSDEEVAMATIADDPDTSGTQYTRVTVSGSNIGFLEAGVQARDLFRTNFGVDALGEETYDEYVVDAVINESALRLVTGPAGAISVAQKFEIHHTRSKTELVTQLGEQAGTYGNRRVCAVWPDLVGSGGVTFPGYHMAAALAGLASGVVPHQHLTNVQIAGFDDVSRANKLFTQAQLDDLAAYGVWIVTKDNDGNILSRDALTTDMTSLQSKTEMVVRNVDSISYLIRSRLVKYIGRTNVTDTALAILRIELVSAIEFLKSNGFTARLGSQLIDGDIIQLRQHIVQKDRVVVAIQLTIPFPMNVIEVHLIA